MPFTVTTGYWTRESYLVDGPVYRETTDDFETLAEAEAFVRLQKKLDAQLLKRAGFTRSGPGKYTISERAMA
jgi:hypothetical protein